MSAFKEQISEDIKAVFLNDSEFAERRTVRYDGKEFRDILIILTGLEEKERANIKEVDHMRSIYEAERILYCDISDLDGIQPEQGTKISINDKEGGGGYFESFYVLSSVCEEGMLEITLGAYYE